MPTKMFANEVQIASQTAISKSEPAIDAAIFERAENAAGQLAVRKDLKYGVIVSCLGRGSWMLILSRRPSALISSERAGITRDNLIGDSKSVTRIRPIIGVGFGDHNVSSAERRCALFVSTKFNLTGGVCRENFVESEIQIVVAEFRYQ